ncbi:hypothetical protein A2886_02670 [candidate division WWE3 bacterium RIFCSPHIGHO2_01_FULL_42_13]|uniref:Uncharacterized protein n=1 Tax=candidate division WWE3 bacterium RIFCSPHIGHO2_01_FULL_42_13 TaxID=1802617 RepID=A0A1F4URS8_UNCKA|nr:MAG: hypothetical protein A2886_02670 [candidate division WWE3 bacterium RIFCSPHIGHO2_01_FULL_42_13]
MKPEDLLVLLRATEPDLAVIEQHLYDRDLPMFIGEIAESMGLGLDVEEQKKLRSRLARHCGASKAPYFAHDAFSVSAEHNPRLPVGSPKQMRFESYRRVRERYKPKRWEDMNTSERGLAEIAGTTEQHK